MQQVGGRTIVGNDYSKAGRDEWRSHVVSRSVSRNAWTGSPMARPVVEKSWKDNLFKRSPGRSRAMGGLFKRSAGQNRRMGGSSGGQMSGSGVKSPAYVLSAGMQVTRSTLLNYSNPHNSSNENIPPRPPAGSPVYARRPQPKRDGVDLTLLLGIAFVVCLCASIATLGVILSGNARKAAPPPVEEAKNPPASVVGPTGNHQINILLLGSDQRAGDGGYRTDVLLLVAIDTEKNTVSAVSFPRDLWVKVPSMYEMKINQVQGLGGFEATAGMFEANFGVKPDYYVMTNFDGFTQFIDNRGGIEVEVGQELTDDCDLPQAKDGDCTVMPGTEHMDGPTALWYVRSRHTTSDLDRLRRAQEVIYAICKKMIDFRSIVTLTEMKAELEGNVETNLSIEKVISLLPVAAHVLNNPDSIHRAAIGEEQASPFWSWNGMWILLPDYEKIDGLLRDAGLKPDPASSASGG